MIIIIYILILLLPLNLYSYELSISEGSVVYKDDHTTIDFKNLKLDYKDEYLTLGLQSDDKLKLLFDPYGSKDSKLPFLSKVVLRGLTYSNNNLSLSIINSPVIAESIIYSKYNIHFGLSSIKSYEKGDEIFLPYHARVNKQQLRALLAYSSSIITSGVTTYYSNIVGLKYVTFLSIKYNNVGFSYTYGENLEYLNLKNSPVQQYAFIIDSEYLEYEAVYSDYTHPLESGSFRCYEGTSYVKAKLNDLTLSTKYNSYFNGEDVLTKSTYYIKYKYFSLNYDGDYTFKFSSNKLDLTIKEDGYKYTYKIRTDDLKLDISILNNSIEFSATIYFKK